ncbi:MAG: hypothetical protein LW650_03260 [Planctomycetaceae bacterium]|nr:hypothetical protein [Planctomycetaceae bacterium]
MPASSAAGVGRATVGVAGAAEAWQRGKTASAAGNGVAVDRPAVLR